MGTLFGKRKDRTENDGSNKLDDGKNEVKDAQNGFFEKCGKVRSSSLGEKRIQQNKVAQVLDMQIV